MFSLTAWTAYWLKQKVPAKSAVHRIFLYLFWSLQNQKLSSPQSTQQ
jgi:hypothetical protein